MVRDLLNQNWLGVLIGIAGIVIGVVTAYVFYRKSKLTARIATKQLFVPIFDDSSLLPSDLKLIFRGKEIQNLSLCMVAIWNSGNTTIDGDRITTIDPLRIVTPRGSQILDVEILKFTDKVNTFMLSSRGSDYPNEVRCAFDFLEPNDGVTIKILYNGGGKPAVIGTIKGMPEGIWDQSEQVSMINPRNLLRRKAYLPKALQTDLVDDVLVHWRNRNTNNDVNTEGDLNVRVNSPE